jgi:hypothetical protein
VIACDLSSKRLKIVKDKIEARGLKVSRFYLNEKQLDFTASEVKE